MEALHLSISSFSLVDCSLSLPVISFFLSSWMSLVSFFSVFLLMLSISAIAAAGLTGAVQWFLLCLVVLFGWTGLVGLMSSCSNEKVRPLTWERSLMEVYHDRQEEGEPPALAKIGLGDLHWRRLWSGWRADLPIQRPSPPAGSWLPKRRSSSVVIVLLTISHFNEAFFCLWTEALISN